ncbi:MAG TPA: DUF2334 domain-containing protein [Terracidiphilus sp.]|jgi:predicted deacetylase
MNEPHASVRREARYLLRLDDLCPTVSLEGWRHCRALIEEFQIRPILAVIPDNHDPRLRISPPDPGFWDQLRAMEADGATIGLHGYRHRCASSGRSLVPLSRESEFAGVSAQIQRDWIGAGLRILRGQGLDPKVWVAPRHGFDRETLSALRSEGIQLLSDGFAARPFRRDGVVWIPQQIWQPVEKAEGLWTICLHPHTIGNCEIAKLRAFLKGHATQFTSIERVLAEFPSGKLSVAEQLRAQWSLWRTRVSRAKRDLSTRTGKNTQV